MFVDTIPTKTQIVTGIEDIANIEPDMFKRWNIEKDNLLSKLHSITNEEAEALKNEIGEILYQK